MKSNHYHNPFHSIAAQADNEAGALVTLQQGVEYEVNDFVALELTAEEMIENEASLLGAYISDDAQRVQGFWHELKEELLLLELSAGEWLLSAADPTSLEWQRAHWWQADDEPKIH